MTIEEIRGLDKRADILDLIEEQTGSREVPFSTNPKNPKTEDAKAYLMSLVSTLPKVKSSKEVDTRSKKMKAKIASDFKMKNLLRVIIVDNDPISTVSEVGDANLMEYKQYGNTVSGFETAKVAFGTPWFLPEMLVDQLDSVTYSPYIQKGNGVVIGKETKKYSITRLPQLTQKELDQMKLKAKMAEASKNLI